MWKPSTLPHNCSLQWRPASVFRSMHDSESPSPSPSPSPSSSSCGLSISQKVKTETQMEKKPRILCLHGFRTSAKILETQIQRWPQTLLDKLDLDFVNGPFPARGKSDVEGFFNPPYFEWYHSNQDFTEYFNFEECLAFIEDYMMKNGPFDGLLGFSQGALISAAVPGMQRDGVALTKVPKVKFVILISGAKFGGYRHGLPKLAANAYKSTVRCPSLHIIGERDFLREHGSELLEAFEDPAVIHHSRGHSVPRLDAEGLETMLRFIEKIRKIHPTETRHNGM